MENDSPERCPGQAQLGDMLLHLALAALLDIAALGKRYLRNACCKFEYIRDSSTQRIETTRFSKFITSATAHTEVTHRSKRDSPHRCPCTSRPTRRMRSSSPPCNVREATVFAYCLVQDHDQFQRVVWYGADSGGRTTLNKLPSNATSAASYYS